jgi:hypothetical protein
LGIRRTGKERTELALRQSYCDETSVKEKFPEPLKKPNPRQKDRRRRGNVKTRY